MPHASRVESLIRSASRRFLLVLAVEQSAVPIAVLLAGVIVLLLLGTDILNGYWLALVACGAAVLAVVRIRRGLLGRYRVAQLLDRHFGLKDSLSTAWFLRTHPDRAHSPAAQFQIEHAERLAPRVQPHAALPFAGYRAWAVAACLALAGFGLFALRYLEIDTLSLRPPLIPVHVAIIPDLEEFFRSEISTLPFLSRLDQQQAHAEKRLNASGQSRSEADFEDSRSASAKNIGLEQQQASGNGENGSNETSSAMSSNRPAKPEASAQAKPQMASQNNANGSPQDQASSRSLLDRMKDAFSELMADMRAGSDRKASQNTPQTPNPSANRSNAMSAGTRPADNARDTGMRSQIQAAQRQAASLRNSQTSSKRNSEAQSGIGSQNGDKELKKAEELAAMGKLAEIVGKRSADLTGSMTLLSGPAQLQTPDSHQVGRHSNLGGEIHRDEIPPIYRDYVRHYMEEVRKSQNAPQ